MCLCRESFAYPRDDAQFQQFLNCIIHIEVTALTKLFFNKLLTPQIQILDHIIIRLREITHTIIL